MPDTSPRRHHEIVIVGGGFSGLGTAIALRKAGFDDLLIVDDGDGPGGTWQWNTYPGVAVDIPSFSYQFSFAQRSTWSRSYAPGRELRAYAEQIVDEYGLAPHLQFGTRVHGASFDAPSATWSISTSAGDVTARWLIHAGGPLSQPKLPDIEGIDTFEGATMHTSRWNHEVSLAGKRVGIIGTGATAVQVVPEIAPEVDHLTVFQRTPIWCLPKPDFPLGRMGRASLETVPGVRQIARLASQAFVEATFPVLAHFHKWVPATAALQVAARRYIAAQVHDPATRDALTPTYALGCKRPSFHNSYLSTFNRDNVSLQTTSIEAITPGGIRTSDGVQHELDVLVLATGFKVTDRDALPTYPLTSADGTDLAEHWDAERFHTYQGVATAGFPNFFTVFGPYGYNGASFFTLVENSAAHIVRVLTEARRRRATFAEVTSAAQEQYMSAILARRSWQVFTDPTCAGANSYYFTANGDVPFRASTTPEAAWRSRRFPLADYAFGGRAG
ncbi:NAD(P)/FAD-dependent oxidoreductase [Rhodococcus sp. BP-316]|jgi:cation diffusion facilitator CzcD-associated flavoprotein CzcO|uniref:flavin-containing monooxygenase n=1 Tax=unclassified Rhodococcus (in: high G+C Gram-positive bacteria) TaxID=192944 RepID=UPI0006F5D96F|nr:MULTISPECIES: NAD(P)/FAD-dependent oxidoreductase [unclassified Rhodococcus (in: high G+C Gram-positive bacteria)]KQU29454.1 monooxygenase [Rhodococcus sp. Leaf225]KQU41084.1 monooxygenase [Rhodococcus sp. Leaf258]MBY6676343.1 NAD(P)/FAD-dependent oxidoreductase [Rhodococcus sp. BP-332]MBY6681444.1 NAD(P)/FAD-dependent oxidoreductase [Rhodococcus sp. BP-316]MBY6708754.1 NAD(P)/FAD-dependent oxidoreductase [Rhodococcus sp. BP-241]